MTNGPSIKRKVSPHSLPEFTNPSAAELWRSIRPSQASSFIRVIKSNDLLWARAGMNTGGDMVSVWNLSIFRTPRINLAFPL